MLVVSTETISGNWYKGNSKGFLLSNCLFRVGGSAALLSNRRGDRRNAQFQLSSLVRTHYGADDEAYGAVYRREVCTTAPLGASCVAVLTRFVAIVGVDRTKPGSLVSSCSVQ